MPPASALERSTGLSGAVAVDVMQHLSGLLADTEAATLYAADVPGRPFHELDDARDLGEELDKRPPAAQVSDVRSRMVLRKPFTFVPLPNADGEPSTLQMQIDVPDLSLSIFGKQFSTQKDHQATGDWKLMAERDLSIRQPLRVSTITQLDGPTSLSVAWEKGAEVTDVTNDAALLPPDGLTQRFRQGWTRWADSQQQLIMELPDVAVGSARMRLDQFVWQGEMSGRPVSPGGDRADQPDRPRDCVLRPQRRLPLERSPDAAPAHGACLPYRGADADPRRRSLVTRRTAIGPE